MALVMNCNHSFNSGLFKRYIAGIFEENPKILNFINLRKNNSKLESLSLCSMYIYIYVYIYNIKI
jgi:hypothetical protein